MKFALATVGVIAVGMVVAWVCYVGDWIAECDRNVRAWFVE